MGNCLVAAPTRSPRMTSIPNDSFGLPPDSLPDGITAAAAAAAAAAVAAAAVAAAAAAAR